MKTVEEGASIAWIPAAVVAEIVLLRELGRIAIGFSDIKTAMEQASGFRFLPLDMNQLDEFVALGTIRDAFDRLIVGASRALNAKLVTKDDSIRELGLVQTVWS
jgi:PIN domain nuclease of toxin-antitoxin system